MKKQIVSLLLMAAIIPATVVARSTNPVTTMTSDRQVRLTGNFTRILAEGNVKVVLYESDAKAVSIIETAGKKSHLDITEKDGVLQISSTRYFGSPAIVYVPVRRLQEITAKGGAEISSEGVLHSHLTVRLSGDCKVSVIALDKINLVQDADTEIEIEKSNLFLVRES